MSSMGSSIGCEPRLINPMSIVLILNSLICGQKKKKKKKKERKKKKKKIILRKLQVKFLLDHFIDMVCQYI